MCQISSLLDQKSPFGKSHFLALHWKTGLEGPMDLRRGVQKEWSLKEGTGIRQVLLGSEYI